MDSYGTPMLALISARYYATLQRYDKWNRSVLRVYDDQNRPVYQEVLAGNCASLRTLSNKNGLEDLLLGCDGKLLRYSLVTTVPVDLSLESRQSVIVVKSPLHALTRDITSTTTHVVTSSDRTLGRIAVEQ